MSSDMAEEKKQDPATLQVGEEEVKLNMSEEAKEEEETVDLDLQERDPDDMNRHVKVRFHEVFAEPDKEVFSFDKIWLLSFKVFTNTKIWCYRITSLILALPCAACWGVCFACVSFCNIWMYMPCLRCHDVELFCFRRCYTIVLSTFIAPCFEAVGRIFGSIGIRVRKEP